MNMFYYYFIIVFFWILFFLFSLYIVLKKNLMLFEKVSPYLLFISLFFYFLIWIPQGLDITDEGFTLTKSWFFLHGGWKDNIDMIWMSSLINGLWLSICGGPSLIWGRIGYAIIVSATSVLAFLILKLYFNKTKAFITVFLMTIFYTINAFFSITYYSLPIFSILLSIYLLLNFIGSRNHTVLIIAGFIIALLGFMKSPFILAPLLFFIYLKFLVPANKVELKRIIRNSFLGLFSGYLFGIIILLSSGSFNTYFNSVFIGLGIVNNPFPTSDFSHTRLSLLSIYSENFYRLFYSCLIAINILIIYLISISYLNRKVWKVVVSVLFTYFIYLLSKRGDSDQWEYITITFCFVYSFLNLFNRESNTQLRLVMLLSIFIFIISFLGSNGGIITGFQSGGMLLLSSISILAIDDIDPDLDSLPFVSKSSFKYLKFIFGGFLILVLISKKPDDVYRERPRDELKFAFKSAQLSGILSNKQRVNSIDSLLIAYDNIKKSSGNRPLNTLAINSNPLFYYLVNTKPYLSNPWFFSTKRFEHKLITEPKPEIFVFSLQNPRNLSWPLNNSKPCDGLDSLDYKYFMRYVLRNNYMSAYKSRMFQIFAQPELLYNIEDKNLVLDENPMLPVQNTPSWEKLRPNCSIKYSQSNVPSVNKVIEIDNTLEGGTGGIYRSVLKVDDVYFVNAKVKSDFPAKIILQAGGGNSVVNDSLKINTWMEIKGFLKATGTDFIIYIDNMPLKSKFSVGEVGVFHVSKK